MSEQLDPVVDLVRNAIGYGVMMALENRTGLIRRMQDAGPGVTMADLLAGTVTLMMDSVASALPHIRAGKLLPLAVTTPGRVPQLPEVPTLAEAVSPGYGAFGWVGLCGPAGMPSSVMISLPSRSGRTRARSSCAASSSMRRSRPS